MLSLFLQRKPFRQQGGRTVRQGGLLFVSSLFPNWTFTKSEEKHSMNTQPSSSQGDDVDDEAPSSSTEDDMTDDASQDSLTVVRSTVLPPHTSSHPPGSKDVVLPHVLPINVPASQLRAPNGLKIDGTITLEDDKKREHKRRSKNWTRPETLKLIKMRKELDDQFRKSGRKIALWEEIALALQKEKFSRDGQQCKDKWEKLTAGYKEVRDGTRDKADHPFYNELDDLLSWKSYRKETDGCGNGGDAKHVKFEDLGGSPRMPNWSQMGIPYTLSHGFNSTDMRDARFNHLANNMEMKSTQSNHGIHNMDVKEAHRQENSSPGKRKREEVVTLLDTGVIQELLDTILSKQEKFLKDMLDAVDRREQMKEQMRREREDRWREEDRAQRFALSSALIQLTQRLLGGERLARPPAMNMDIVPANLAVTAPNGLACPKKRSKNWKKSEVWNLIRIRQEMENKFVMSTRRAGLWDELGEKLASLGIHRDGKQCREKWDKLMAEYKDVIDGRKDKDESTHFAQLTSVLGRLKDGDGDTKSSSETTKDEGTTADR